MEWLLFAVAVAAFAIGWMIGQARKKDAPPTPRPIDERAREQIRELQRRLDWADRDRKEEGLKIAALSAALATLVTHLAKRGAIDREALDRGWLWAVMRDGGRYWMQALTGKEPFYDEIDRRGPCEEPIDIKDAIRMGVFGGEFGGDFPPDYPEQPDGRPEI